MSAINGNNNDPKAKPGEAENDPSEAITTPKEVEESNDANIEKDFPGYPHYPAKDDILDPDNNNGKVDLDVENLSQSIGKVRLQMRDELLQPADRLVNTPFDEAVEDDDDNDDLGIVEGTEADVTAEDLAILGALDQDMDLGEDEDINGTSSLLDKAGYELDVPGAEIDDANESIGEEDEENNYYSIGGDAHDNLEENDRNTF